jgi:integrase
MANRRVSIWKYVKIVDRWRYCRPALGKNGKIKPDVVIVGDGHQYHPEGNYYIHRLEHGRQIWKKIGPNPADAVNAAKVEESFLNAQALGIKVEREIPKLDFDAQMWKFLQDYKLSQKEASHELMSQTLSEFRQFCKKPILSEITREDLLKYKKWLVGKNRSLRTAGNKMLRVNQFMRAALGQRPGEGLVTVKDAKFVEREPEVYSDAELTAFFKECSEFHNVVFSTLLYAGLRKQEMENLEWLDIDFDERTVRVTAKLDFQPKDWEERTVEVHSDLVEILYQWKLKPKSDVTGLFCTRWNERIHRGGSRSWPSRGTNQSRS